MLTQVNSYICECLFLKHELKCVASEASISGLIRHAADDDEGAGKPGRPADGSALPGLYACP